MIRAPNRKQIAAVERKVAQSMHQTQDRVHRVRAEFRATFARSSTMLLVAGAAGVAGFCLAHRRHAKPLSSGVSIAAATSIAALVRRAIVGYGMQLLPVLLERFHAAFQKCAA